MFDSSSLNFVQSDIQHQQMSPWYLSQISGALWIKIINADVQGHQMLPIGLLQSKATLCSDVVLTFCNLILTYVQSCQFR